MKIEELKRRYTGPIGCPSDTKDPDYWDWDNWDNWPQEDKDMFPIEEERARLAKLGESVSFQSLGKETDDPSTWHDDYDYDWLEQHTLERKKMDAFHL